MSQPKSLHQKVREARQLLREGYQFLKPSFCSFRFHPKYLEALECFEQASKEFKKMGLHEDRLVALEECAKCNKMLNLFLAEAANYKEACDVELLLLESSDKDEKSAFNLERLTQYLSNASFSYIKAGQFRDSAQIYNQLVEKLKLNKEYQVAYELVTVAFDNNIINFDDNLVRISLGEMIVTLLDIYCELGHFTQAISKLVQFIDSQLEYKNEINDNSRILQNYMMLAVLRIINDEEYLLSKIVNDMYKVYDTSCSDEIRDVQRLEKAFMEKNKKEFTFCMNNVIFLYPNAMLKAIRKKFNDLFEEKNTHSIENNIISNINEDSGHNFNKKYDNLFGQDFNEKEYEPKLRKSTKEEPVGETNSLLFNEYIDTDLQKKNRTKSVQNKNQIFNRLK